MIKKVAIIGHENYGVREIFTRIVNDHRDIEFILIITKGLYYQKSFIGSIFKMLKVASLRFCFSRFIELLRYKINGDTLEKRAIAFGIPIHYTYDVNGQISNDFIKKFNPDLILSTFTMNILKKNTINASKIATIGCHPSILPQYRGLETFFWALANDEKVSGVSVFYITEKIDHGKVILQEKFNIENNETVESIYIKLTTICAKLISEAVYRIKHNLDFEIISAEGNGSYFPMPTRAAYKKFKNLGKKWK